MPPSPRITITLDEAIYSAACLSLSITPPPVAFRKSGANGRFRGHYHPASRSITIYHGLDEQNIGALRSLQGELVRTLLHELRHAWQDANGWVYEDRVVESENDANRWADENQARYRLILRVTRSFPGSGFSRMSRHATGRSV